MKRGLSWMSALVVVVMVGAASLAEAQNGPYYAVPSWDQTLACSTENSCPRFIVVMGGEAVLDRETGLVWERSPSVQELLTWQLAKGTCHRKLIGNRKGWRLPTIQDLASLIDPSVASPGPMLAAGHPFIGVHSAAYWSATSASGTDTAWRANFGSGAITITAIANPEFFWCVRGGHGPDAQ
jgi:hypothetical protein